MKFWLGEGARKQRKTHWDPQVATPSDRESHGFRCLSRGTRKNLFLFVELPLRVGKQQGQ